MTASHILRLILVLFTCFNSRLRAQELVYDNTQTPLNQSFDSLDEFGDETKLVAASEINSFSAEYFAEFAPTGAEFVRVRFRLNDGPDIDPRPDKQFLAPGSVVYDSGPIAIGPGFNAISLVGLRVSVPQTFTWTVQFSGLANTPNSHASLMFFNPPTIGSSFDDFWRHKEGQWGLYRFGGSPVANFGSRILANHVTPLEILDKSRMISGAMQVKIGGPPGQSVILDSSPDGVTWRQVTQLILTNRITLYVDTTAPAPSEPVYRVSSLNAPTMRFTHIAPTQDQGTALEFTGNPGGIYELQTSFDSANWLTVISGVFPGGVVSHVDRSATLPRRFFRLRSGPSLTAQFDLSATFATNRVFQTSWEGPPGKYVVLEASTDLSHWSPISTNQFSFTTGAITWIDAHQTPTDRRFYRAAPWQPAPTTAPAPVP